MSSPAAQNIRDMSVLLYPAHDSLTMSRLPVPEPGAGEVLLSVAACGICGSELESFRSHSPRRPPPLVMGHEFCGTVASLGSGVSTVRPGDRVVANAVVPCGKCPTCLRGAENLCPHRQVFGMNRSGAFAEFVVVPERVLLSWPDSLSPEEACLAEPLANGVHVANLTRSFDAETVLVIGAGPIGLFCQQALQALRGSKVWVTDLSEDRLKIASRLGACGVVNGKSADRPVWKEIFGPEGPALVVDAVGATTTKQLSLELVRPGGVAVWIGLQENDLPVASYGITLPEKCILGSYSAFMGELQVALDLMASRRVDAGSWLSQWPLKEADSAFQAALQGGTTVKAVVQMEPAL